ncbi:hypothetical protein [Isoptericola jiangsuensis]|nr:hypothetical protein [Isoptericola jiangsuensis]
MSDRQQPYEGYQPPAYTGYTGQDTPPAPAWTGTPGDPYASAPGPHATYPAAPGYGAPAYPQQPTDPPGRTLGIVGFVLAFVMPLAGIVVSALSLSESRKAQAPNALGTWGLWLSIAFTVGGLLLFLGYFALVFATAGLALTTS